MFMRIQFSRHTLKILNYQILLKSIHWDLSCVHADGWTDMTKIIFTFLNFGNAPKIHFVPHREHSALTLQRPIG